MPFGFIFVPAGFDDGSTEADVVCEVMFFCNGSKISLPTSVRIAIDLCNRWFGIYIPRSPPGRGRVATNWGFVQRSRSRDARRLSQVRQESMKQALERMTTYYRSSIQDRYYPSMCHQVLHHARE